jgi:hypothetical protein
MEKETMTWGFCEMMKTPERKLGLGLAITGAVLFATGAACYGTCTAPSGPVLASVGIFALAVGLLFVFITEFHDALSAVRTRIWVIKATPQFIVGALVLLAGVVVTSVGGACMNSEPFSNTTAVTNVTASLNRSYSFVDASFVDECGGVHACHANATCENMPTGYLCRCAHPCLKPLTTHNIKRDAPSAALIHCALHTQPSCDPRIRGGSAAEKRGRCSCAAGFHGDGFACTGVDDPVWLGLVEDGCYDAGAPPPPRARARMSPPCLLGLARRPRPRCGRAGLGVAIGGMGAIFVGLYLIVTQYHERERAEAARTEVGKTSLKSRLKAPMAKVGVLLLGAGLVLTLCGAVFYALDQRSKYVLMLATGVMASAEGGAFLALVLARPELDAFKADAVAARRKPGLIAGLVLLLAGMACGAVGGAMMGGEGEDPGAGRRRAQAEGTAQNSAAEGLGAGNGSGSAGYARPVDAVTAGMAIAIVACNVVAMVGLSLLAVKWHYQRNEAG